MAAVALVLAACSSGDGATESTEIDPDPIALDRAASTVDLGDEHVPAPFADREIVDPGWSTPPKTRDDLFLGLRPLDDSTLEFTATDESGRIHWAARRPLTCTGFTLTTVEGRPLAVLSDLRPGTDSVTITTVTAYDLASGEEMWGPVEVPGGHVGPGLVYSEVPTATLGETGPRVALDAATGEVVADEQDVDARVVGEYDGLVLTASDGELVAREAADRREAWRVPLTDLGPIDPDDVAAAPPPAVESA